MKTLHRWPDILHWIRSGAEEICEFERVARLHRLRRSTSRAEKVHTKRFHRAFPWAR